MLAVALTDVRTQFEDSAFRFEFLSLQNIDVPRIWTHHSRRSFSQQIFTSVGQQNFRGRCCPECEFNVGMFSAAQKWMRLLKKREMGMYVWLQQTELQLEIYLTFFRQFFPGRLVSDGWCRVAFTVTTYFGHYFQNWVNIKCYVCTANLKNKNIFSLVGRLGFYNPWKLLNLFCRILYHNVNLVVSSNQNVKHQSDVSCTFSCHTK